MQGTIGPDVARAAVAFRRNHPSVPAIDVLDVCMRLRTGSVADFGIALEPTTPVAALVREALNLQEAAWPIVVERRADSHGLRR